ncbi:MAG: NADP-dependent malic enzyme [Candidatus Krumholzibacteriota bacterium]|nr:NADP-dependent malic enzyme [Candidatus Krumholzibacteriota bacterium]
MPTKRSKKESLRRAALEYHSRGRKGKIEVTSTKPCVTQRDLSLAYTPGVAAPCLAIEKDPATVREYTAKGNLVAVVSDGTAVLGLGNIGALASKPVMEGKGVLFKRFADIDVFDIELDLNDPDEIIRTVKAMEPTFGGINLEDIKAPQCFYIEEKLKELMNIPVFHDDQHGTAIISGAALLNAVEVVGKDIAKIKVVFSGAGAAGIACANFYLSLGVQLENVLMVDSKGVLWEGRGDEDKNPYKKKYFRKTEARELGDAMKGADVFCGVSTKDVLKPEMVKTMADKPLIFAMANPDPEITYEAAKRARPDCIMATGRSDYPNQVNNVLGFPFIFRGALDVQATAINEEMKRAAARALADLAKEEVPDSVKRAYDDANLSFGPDYIIPKPFDPRVLTWEAVAVAKAAMDTGVAQKPVDIDEYREQLIGKLDWSRETMRKVFSLAQRDPKRIVFPEGTHPKIIWAASEIVTEGIARPILLGRREEILRKFDELHHDPEGIEIVEPKTWPHREDYIRNYYKLRQRKGVTLEQARLDMKNFNYFGAMMVMKGHADGMVGGVGQNYPDILRPALQVIGPRAGGKLVAGLYILIHQNRIYCLADCAVNVEPTAAELAEIAVLSAAEMEQLHLVPRIAMLSFANFGSVRCGSTDKVAAAVEIIRKELPHVVVDGPVQAGVALDPEMMREHFPFSDLKEQPNLLIFPDLDAGNISLRLLERFSSAHSIGPIIMGMERPVHLVIREAEVNAIVNLTAIACVDAQNVARRLANIDSALNYST